MHDCFGAVGMLLSNISDTFICTKGIHRNEIS